MKWFAQITYFVVLMLLFGCTDRAGDYPALSPTDQLLAESLLQADEVYPTAQSNTQKTRADALRGRAADLRGPVIDPETRRRMTRPNG